METVIGFIAGYLVGAKDGEAGMARLRKSVEEIAASPELRRLAGEAAGIAGVVLRQTSRRGLTGIAGEVTSRLVGRPDSEHARAA
jgi:hypothetical protein